MVLGAIVGGLVSGIFGGISSSSQASASNDAQGRLDDYNKQLWEYNWKQDNINRDFQISQNTAQRTNLSNQNKYTVETQVRDWRYSSQMDAIKYNTELEAYRKSDDLYKAQLNLNNASENVALKQQAQWMREQELNNAFQVADLGLQLQSSLNSYTQSLLADGFANRFADLQFSQTKQFAEQNFDLSIGQAQREFNQTTQFSREKFGKANQDSIGIREELRATTARDREKASIQAMRDRGAAVNSQAGRSTAKLVQSIGFIGGIDQAALTDRILFGEAGISRQLADEGLAMSQTNRQAGLKGQQSMQIAAVTNYQTQQDATLKRAQSAEESALRLYGANLDRLQAKSKYDNEMTGAAASLVSARISNQFTSADIQMEKYLADLNTYAAKMLPPVAPLERPAPLLLPEAIILDPPALVKPPQPVAGATTSPVAAFLGGAAGGLGSAIGAGVSAAYKGGK